MATPVLGDVKHLYHRTWWALVLRALLALVVGIFILARPLESVAAFALVIAVWALFTGMVDVVHAIELASVMKHWWVLLLSGLVGVGFGILALIYYRAFPELRRPVGRVVAPDLRRPRHLCGAAAEEARRSLGLDGGRRRPECRRVRLRAIQPADHAGGDHGAHRWICDSFGNRPARRSVQAPLARARRTRQRLDRFLRHVHVEGDRPCG